MSRHDSNESLAKLGFLYSGEIVAPDGTVIVAFEDHNLIPQIGIDHVAGLLRGVGSPISSWYLGVYANNYMPTNDTTAADLPAAAGESLAYSQATRPIWNNTYDGVSVISNTASRAEFSFTAATRLYGGFLVSNNNKGANTGTLLSIAKFATPYDVPAGSVFRLGVAITLISTN